MDKLKNGGSGDSRLNQCREYCPTCQRSSLLLATKFQSLLAPARSSEYACGNEADRRMEFGENPEQFALL
jgi:hypothetical protein